MSVDFNDIDVLAFIAGGQFFEEDVEDEVLACVTDGQFGVELEDAVVPTIPVARSTGGGGGGGAFRYVVPVGECWEWERRGQVECSDDWPPTKKDVPAPWEPPRLRPVPVTLGQIQAPPAFHGRSLVLGALAGAAAAVVALWLYRRWENGRPAEHFVYDDEEE